ATIAGLLFRHGARVFLLRHHEHENLEALVRARVARSRMNCAGWLVECVPGLQKTRRLVVDRKLVRAFHHISKRVVARMPMRRAADPRRALDKAHTYLSSRQIGERLRKNLRNARARGLREGRCHQPDALPGYEDR